jgi:type I restriction enzyme S subunit
MAGRYKAYPEYKESGIEWLGKVPQGWSIHSLKRSVDGVTNGIWGNEPDNESDLIVLRVADFNRDQLNISDDKLTFRSIDPKDRASRLLKKGDLLIEKSGGGDKTLVGCVVLFDKDYPAVTSNFVAKMTPQEGFDSSFLRYAFSQLYAGKVNFPSIKQTTGIQNLDSDAYLLESFVFPSFTEQQKIANFLDHETAKIDTLIAKQEKLIELLKEKRQAVISHAVTKGLNPNAPMRDSGVEWLGEVPEHWKVTRFKYLCENIVAGPFGSSITKDMYKKSGYKVYGQEQVIPNNFKIGDYFISTEDYLRLARYKVTKGDVLISCVGTFGKVSVFPSTAQAGIINPRLIKAKIHKANSPYFIREYLKSVTVAKQFDQFSRGGTMGVINIAILNEIISTKPPYVEQCEIYDFIKAQKSKFSLLLDRCEKQIALLKERKTALISAAVTGKIDVRDFVSEQGQPQGI